jgi:hypothetical protein
MIWGWVHVDRHDGFSPAKLSQIHHGLHLAATEVHHYCPKEHPVTISLFGVCIISILLHTAWMIIRTGQAYSTAEYATAPSEEWRQNIFSFYACIGSLVVTLTGALVVGILQGAHSLWLPLACAAFLLLRLSMTYYIEAIAKRIPPARDISARHLFDSFAEKVPEHIQDMFLGLAKDWIEDRESRGHGWFSQTRESLRMLASAYYEAYSEKKAGARVPLIVKQTTS